MKNKKGDIVFPSLREARKWVFLTPKDLCDSTPTSKNKCSLGCGGIKCLIGQKFGGHNCRKFGLVPKIMSAENLCPPKILSAENVSGKH